mgnify:CR=1 FL=1
MSHKVSVLLGMFVMVLLLSVGDEFFAYASTHEIVTTLSGTFNYPKDVAVDSTGNIYVADTDNHKIKKITPDGVVTTISGTFNFPSGLAIDPAGNIYVADYGSNTIKKITPDGVVTTFASSFNSPRGLDVDSTGNIYVADYGSNTIKKITPDGVVTTFAGSGVQGFKNALNVAAEFNSPIDIVIDSAGNIYVADMNNNKIRKIDRSNNDMVTTFAGSSLGYADGSTTDAKFKYPSGLTMDFAGNIYVTDSYNNRIRHITTDGVVSTIAGSGTLGNAIGPPLASAEFNYPEGISVDSSLNLYIADSANNQIRKIALSPTFTAVTNSATQTIVTFSEKIGGTLTYSQWSIAGHIPTSVAGNIDGSTNDDITTLVFTHSSIIEQTPDVSYTAGDLKDKDNTPNTMVTATVTASDGIIPTLTTATLNAATGVLSLVFSESIDQTPSSRVDLSKLFLSESGEVNQTVLTGATYTGGADGKTISITLTPSQKNAVDGYTTPQIDIISAAVYDTSGVSIAATDDQSVNWSLPTSGTFTLPVSHKTFNVLDNSIPSTLHTSGKHVLNFAHAPAFNSISKSVTISTSLTNIYSVVAGYNVEVQLPANLLVTGTSAWDGVFMLPAISSDPPPSGQTAGLVISLGGENSRLEFDKAVKIVLPSQSGLNVFFNGYSSSGVLVAELLPTCTFANTQNAANAGLTTIGGTESCFLVDGIDMVIWTKHASSYGSSSITSKSGGGGNSSTPPSFTTSFEAGTNTISIGELGIAPDKFKTSHTLDTPVSVKTAISTPLSLMMHDVESWKNISHVELCMNKQISNNKVCDSDTKIIWDKNSKNLEIIDPNKFFNSVTVKISEINSNVAKFDFSINFGNTMDASDVQIYTWNTSRDALIFTVENAIVVSLGTTNNDVVSSGSISLDSISPSTSDTTSSSKNSLSEYEIIKQWAGYSAESVSDTQVLDNLDISNNYSSTLPKWIKSYLGKLVVNNEISVEQLRIVLSYMVGYS